MENKLDALDEEFCDYCLGMHLPDFCPEEWEDMQEYERDCRLVDMGMDDGSYD